MKMASIIGVILLSFRGEPASVRGRTMRGTSMPRTLRSSAGNLCYHIINRGNGGMGVFGEDEDFSAFIDLLSGRSDRMPMRVAAYCVMPDHFHLVVWPKIDGELSRWMQWLMTAQVRRHHQRHGTSGHLWQGRFKAFPVQKDDHLLDVLRYVERNPVRAGLVKRAGDWPWSSHANPRTAEGERPVRATPVALPADWSKFVALAESPDDLDAIRRSVNRGAPYGKEKWIQKTAGRLGLESTLNPLGRPRLS
jgi:putative transposase